MQLRQVVKLDKNTIAVVYEMRVRDVRHLVMPGSELSDKPLQGLVVLDFARTVNFLKPLIELPAELPFAKITGEQLGLLMEAWDSVNAVFYKKKPGKPANNPGREIDKICAQLIGLGHVDVWDYGWAFFNEVLNDLKR